MEPGMPDNWVPPDWMGAGFPAEDADLGAIVLRARAEPDRVRAEALEICRQLDLDQHARDYLLTRSLEVIDAVVHRSHGWRNA
eukprot:9073435-Alexandrium_andersonii.AAC.1